jgi:hypothetical protein
MLDPSCLAVTLPRHRAPETPMAESLAREAVKRSMKAWIVTSDKVQETIAQLREDFEDLIAEARAEYEQQATTDAQADADDETTTETTAPSEQATRGRVKRGRRGQDTDDAQETTD